MTKPTTRSDCENWLHASPCPSTIRTDCKNWLHATPQQAHHTNRLRKATTRNYPWSGPHTNRLRKVTTQLHNQATKQTDCKKPLHATIYDQAPYEPTAKSDYATPQPGHHPFHSRFVWCLVITCSRFSQSVRVTQTDCENQLHVMTRHHTNRLRKVTTQLHNQATKQTDCEKPLHTTDCEKWLRNSTTRPPPFSQSPGHYM